MAGRSPQLPLNERKPDALVRSINALATGRGDNRGTFSLTASATTTTVTNPNVSSNSTIVLSPRSATAAAALGVVYISAKAEGSFTVTHNSSAATDRTFDYEFRG